MRLKPDNRTGSQIGLQLYAEAAIVVVGGGLSIWAASSGYPVLASTIFAVCFLYFVVSRVLHYLRRIDTDKTGPHVGRDT
jgi:hypothetical protein